MEQHFKDAGLSNSFSQTQHTSYEMFTSAFDIILMVLVVMAGLLAMVGGLSLTGTMGMNVLERTREIGVLRAVGAANSAVRQVVVVEGVVVGLMSWFMSAIVSAPVGRMLASAVVESVLKASVNFQYSVVGPDHLAGDHRRHRHRVEPRPGAQCGAIECERSAGLRVKI